MSEDKPHTLCPTCRERIDPDDPGVIYAVEDQRLDTMGGRDYVEGLGGFFHPDCGVPPGWRVKPQPTQP